MVRALVLRARYSSASRPRLLLCRLSLQPQPYIFWNAEGNGFCIPDVSLFEQNVLPTYYKHKCVRGRPCSVG